MPTFSRISQERLATCEQPLQDLFNEVIKEFDCSILCGHRGEKEQNEAYENGFSKLRYPYSNHNTMPSVAVDVAPYFDEEPHIRWNDEESFHKLADIVFRIAKEKNINVKWGGNWKGFIDIPHWEIAKDK